MLKRSKRKGACNVGKTIFDIFFFINSEFSRPDMVVPSCGHLLYYGVHEGGVNFLFFLKVHLFSDIM